jgi:hypothetical protein
LEERRNVGESRCNFGDGTDQRVDPLTFMMMNFHVILEKKNQLSNFMKTLSVRAEFCHADRRRDRHDKAEGRFP